MPNKTVKRTMFFIKSNIVFEIWLEYVIEYLTLPNIITIIKDRKLFKKELNKVKKKVLIMKYYYFVNCVI